MGEDKSNIFIQQYRHIHQFQFIWFVGWVGWV